MDSKIISLNPQPDQAGPLVVEVVVHAAFKNAILSGHKVAIMLQHNFKKDGIMKFSCADGLKEIPFATAIARDCAYLQLNSKRESIMRQVALDAKKYWVVCSKDQVKKIIFNEGFAHTDDFWRNIEARGVFEVNQFYFDSLKIIGDAPATVKN